MSDKKLKQGWEIKKLGEVCNLITCGVAAKPKYTDVGIPFLSAKNVKNGKVIFSDYKNISKETHLELTKNNKPEYGDILYTRVGSYGDAAVIEKNIEFSVFVSLTLIKVKNEILNNYYLKYFLNSEFIKSLAKKSISGSGVGNLNVGTVRNFEISIPPLAEQERIVSILDKAFSAIDQAKQNAEKNLKNAKELFDSYLNDIFTNKGDDWEEVELDYIVEIRNGRSQKEVLSETGLYKIMGSAGNVMGYANEYICEAGTTIIGRKGNISKPIYIEEKFWNVDTAFGFYPRNNLLENKFLYYLCLTINFETMNRGTTIPSLVKSELQKIKIYYPPLLEQKIIVSKLDTLLAEIKQLENIYQQKITELEKLKKSILQKAFNGDL